MYLKSLILKGFKSFAAPTTLKLEPGICAVVGPNGSGKSNVVDALAWVMGEHSAKTLRGGKMEDVIFAGAGDRKPLGRAEVTLTIDNSDGALPIEYTEVSVTRRMFRDGASEYEINGAKARLMDIQELLSDSGIGREMHVIVGQGRLSQILESKPEERRAFIEEAAGVLKHKRRKEKAQRKLVNMQANLDRLHDLTDELRKQLGPLARQAEAAQQASTVQASIRAARVQLAAHQIATLSEQLTDTSRHAELVAEKAQALTEELEQHTEQLTATEEELRQALEAAEAAKNLWYRLSAVSEKNQATLRIARDRAEHSGDTAWTGPDPDELERRAEDADAEQQVLDEAVEIAHEKLEELREQVLEMEEAAREAEQEHLAQVRAVADRREGVVRLLAQHEAALAARDTAVAEVERLSEAADIAQEALDVAAEEHTQAQDLLDGSGQDASVLQDAMDQAQREVDGAERRVDQLRAEQLTLEREIATAQASIAAWQERLRPTDGAAVASSHLSDQGASADLLALSAQEGWAAALAAVLGQASSSGVVTDASPEIADDTLATLETAAEGRAVLFQVAASRESDGGAGTATTGGSSGSWRLDTTPAAGTWLLDLVTVPENIAQGITALLVDVVAVDDLAQARRVVEEDPRLRAVTKTGTVVGSGWAAAGTGGGATPVELTERIDTEQRRVDEHTSRLSDLQATLEGALAAATDSRTTAAAARAALQEFTVAQQAGSTHVAAAEKNLQAAQRQVERALTARDQAEQRASEVDAKVAELSDRVSRIEAEETDQEPDTAARDRAAQLLSQVKAIELEARLEHRSAEERAGASRGRADGLRRQARQARQQREEHERAVARRAASRAMAEGVASQAARVGARISDALDRADDARRVTETEYKQWQAQMSQQRDCVSALSSELGRVSDSSHAAELARTQAQVKMEQATSAAMEQLGMTVDQLLAEDLPEDFDAQVTRAELKKAEKALNSLGKVNPLALEEFKALEERYNFLAQQLEDVEQARADLNDVIKEVDETILRLFTDAWKDVEREFPKVFTTLFPGGAGRLVLTEPEDMLATGIEVEARPPGKKVKRLSLLSGGEKSLTALAMLVAIFRARPSPFYVMDEVEAALDDVNLRRLIALFEELRHDSQLIVITHQKPTMDVANVLYGVTMRGDGVTRVISQRMQRVE